ncbi:MAG: type VI secretion system accessory protein TagJ [Acidobacteriota bacterium]
MTAKDLYQAGKLKEAIQALNGEVRDNPTDVRRRTFLFELLTFAGEYDRAQKQLQVLADSSGDAKLGTVLYLSALHAEKTRKETFAKGDYPTHVADAAETPLTGTLNGRRFATLVDADPRIGPRLECYAAGAYIWIPFKHIEEIEAMPPKRVRDLIWIPALVRTGPEFKAMELGEVLLPALTWDASTDADDNVKLGRVSEWYENEKGEVCPIGQKMLLVDGEELPILELRKLVFDRAEAAPATEATEE